MYVVYSLVNLNRKNQLTPMWGEVTTDKFSPHGCKLIFPMLVNWTYNVHVVKGPFLFLSAGLVVSFQSKWCTLCFERALFCFLKNDVLGNKKDEKKRVLFWIHTSAQSISCNIRWWYAMEAHFANTKITNVGKNCRLTLLPTLVIFVFANKKGTSQTLNLRSTNKTSVHDGLALAL